MITVKQLIDELKCFDGEHIVVVKRYDKIIDKGYVQSHIIRTEWEFDGKCKLVIDEE